MWGDKFLLRITIYLLVLLETTHASLSPIPQQISENYNPYLTFESSEINLSSLKTYVQDGLQKSLLSDIVYGYLTIY